MASTAGRDLARPFLLVMAKAPVAGRVKTRLCPPCVPAEAAALAAAALADVLGAVAASEVAGPRVLALDGEAGDWLPPGFTVVAQRGATFNDRLTHAWATASAGGRPGLQLGMDTPQVTGPLLDDALKRLARPGVDAVLGPALDGGWWALGLQRAHPGMFGGIAMSQGDTGAQQAARLDDLGLRWEALPTLRDLDHFADAVALARLGPTTRTAAALRPVRARLATPAIPAAAR